MQIHLNASVLQSLNPKNQIQSKQIFKSKFYYAIQTSDNLCSTIPVQTQSDPVAEGQIQHAEFVPTSYLSIPVVSRLFRSISIRFYQIRQFPNRKKLSPSHLISLCSAWRLSAPNSTRRLPN